MPLFGGDPRVLPIEIVYEFNKWYDVIAFPLLIIHLINFSSDPANIIIGIVLVIFEFFRILLVRSHKKANIPLFVAFYILTFVPVLIFDFVWLVPVNSKSSLINIVLYGYIIQHIIQLIVGVISYVKFSKYQTGFYEFSKGKLRDAPQNRDQIVEKNLIE